MKKHLAVAHCLTIFGLACFCARVELVAQAPQQRPQDATKTSSEPIKSKEDLEAIFKSTLTKATFTGRWCLIKDGKLTPEKDDRYTIIGVSKIGNDAWLINARIQYGQKDMTLPLPVQVKWAGDTAVITVDNLGMPGGSSYSARVLVFGHSYAGTWSGGDHSGLMNGIITNEAAPPAP